MENRCPILVIVSVLKAKRLVRIAILAAALALGIPANVRTASAATKFVSNVEDLYRVVNDVANAGEDERSK